MPMTAVGVYGTVARSCHLDGARVSSRNKPHGGEYAAAGTCGSARRRTAYSPRHESNQRSTQKLANSDHRGAAARMNKSTSQP